MWKYFDFDLLRHSRLSQIFNKVASLFVQFFFFKVLQERGNSYLGLDIMRELTNSSGWYKTQYK